ncbi:MAG TPA: alpha-1,4-glucan--maltose-1-phosphate maltosyltransferase [Rudaea sp.]|jgi:starch synthase (maltosyl-transferring)|nr:alpha-1,4-glucan--maltose-1-phosphate maltosyltransferase [Rudaea sp.]
MGSFDPALRNRAMVRAKSGASRTAVNVDDSRPIPRKKKTAPESAARGLRMLEIGAASELTDAGAARAASLGFNAVLLRDAKIAESALIRAAGKLARKNALSVLLDIDLHRVGGDSPIAKNNPAWFRRVVAGGWPVDPRHDLHTHEFIPRFEHPEAAAGLAQAFANELIDAMNAGAAGFAVNWPQRIPPPVMRAVIDATRNVHPAARFIAWTPGLTAAERSAIQRSGFDAGFCSLAWWDYRSPWFIDELQDVRGIGDVIASIVLPTDGDVERNRRALKRALACAEICCDGWLMRGAVGDRGVFDESIVAANKDFSADSKRHGRFVGVPWSRIGVWSNASTVTLINSDLDHHASLQSDSLRNLDVAVDDAPPMLGPGEVRTLNIDTPKTIPAALPENAVKKAIAAPRVVIESIAPNVDEARFPAKRVVGDSVVVEADVFSDGHPMLAVRLLWREADRDAWNCVRMRALGNDRWRAEFPLRRQGLYFYTIEAGIDEFAGLRSSLEKKTAARQNIALDVEEIRQFIDRTVSAAPAQFRTALRKLSREIASVRDPAARILAPDAADLMANASEPSFQSRACAEYPVLAERRAAVFAAWYELFPRSQGRGGKHGSFADVIAQLPRIESMGFDVLYFPPIHPIGSTNRKGKNNALTSQPGEPGSPYAIGSAEGGHDAIHRELGTLQDFKKLIAQAKKHGLEIALDFAVQCSPDHPWIKQHPGWFTWRPDGSMRYAENPPKKYEDIVNVDFYAKDAKPALWTALRDIVAFWMKQGVKIFRVDNPHTKPLPFWEWLIADLRALDPEVLFLSEAFTRPKLMHRLAKLGFSQSYTYFTWRNTGGELETYMRELNAPPVRDFLRPNFFVNTPDINPVFLQDSGRAGFLIRAALAATLSGLWGMYSGFELCEAAALPGREEYLDSEKYELRPRDWNAAGNIVAEISQLNRIRRENPALHTHLGINFYKSTNSHILYFGKATPSRDNVLLTAINLDPHNAQESDVELPLWEFGLDDNGMLLTEELIGAHAFEWRGKNQRIRLEPRSPYRIWRVRAERDR